MDKGMSRIVISKDNWLPDGLKLKAYPFKKILDVDHAGIIVKRRLWPEKNKLKALT